MLQTRSLIPTIYNSEGEVIGPIERKALHNMVGLKEDDTLSGSEVKPKKKKKKRRGKTGRKEELSSIGETSRDIDSPGELSDNDHTQDVDVCPPLVYYVEAIDSASIVKEDERSPPSKPVADSLAWQDSSHILVNDDNLFSPKTPKTDRANRDESQSQAGSLSSVSQRTQETVSSPSFSVSESDVTPSRSPINRKTLFPLEDSLEEEDEN